MRTESKSADNLFSVRGRLMLDGVRSLGVVIVKDGRIDEVRTGDLVSNIPEPVRAAHVVSPGLIDLQLNGAFGHEVGGDPSALAALAREVGANAPPVAALAAALPATGVTSFLPTLVSGDVAGYRAGAAALA